MRPYDKNGEAIEGVEITDWPYYINHFVFALSIYLFNVIFFQFCTIFLDLEPIWLSGFGCSIMWYISREQRDHEKLGYFDFEGFYAPTLGIVFVFCLCQAVQMVLDKRKNPHRAVSKYAIFTVAALFIAALVVSILVNDKFRKPFGPKPA
ncbi:hypothetical protein TrRE_jg2699 [Triparma retinervis]|uniref:Uncharacterized protein n=1 Tax=Triparma retinervis TaxID=2557542 RepID=A0A9W7A0G9_9STRA|nr:hypothetical protein TrRE_jg2699 [Triparma retinervis]